jgi:cobalt-zinc-cadmium efflux system outer membrane protein
MIRRLAMLALLPSLLNACVAHDAGYQDVRQVVAGRTGHDVRWYHADSESEAQKKIRQLLAKPLTVESAAQIALLNNPSLQASFEELGIARADLVRALRLPNPKAEAELHFHGDEKPDIELGVLLDITDFFFLPGKSGAANAALDAAKLEVGGRALDLVLDVKKGFYRYLAARQIVELRRSVLLAAKGSYDAAKSIHEAGNISDLDLANEQALYEEARLAVADAETELYTQHQRLRALLGLWSGPGFRVHMRLPDPPEHELPLDDALRRALSQSIDLEIARRRYSAAAKRSNLARAQGWVPEVAAGVAAERDDGEWGVGPAVELEIPLFYQGQGEVARAAAEMRRENRTHTALGVRIRASTQAATARLAAARERVAYMRTTLLPLRERIVNETQLQYNAMNTGIFQLLAAKRAQIETGRTYVEALRDYWLARADLEQLLSGRFVDVGDLPPRSSAPVTSDVAGQH